MERASCFWLAALAVLGASACTDSDGGATAQPPGAGGAPDAAAIPLAALPPEERLVTLTLWPLYDWRETEAGFGDVVPIDGAEACVDRVRPQLGAWEDFEPPVEENCVTLVAEQKMVFEGVAAESELLIVARKEGYWPSVFTAVTWAWDTDTTLTAPPDFSFRLVRADAPWPGLTVPVGETGGSVLVVPFACAGVSCAGLGGVTLALDVPAGDGPFHGRGGVFDPALVETVPSVSGVNILFTASSTADVSSAWPVSAFVNVPEGQHDLRFEHEAADCVARGWANGDVSYGFPSDELNVVRVPVLSGHVTPTIQGNCTCRFDFHVGSAALDPRTCGRFEGDGGAR